jgi:hypothetical protein
MKSFLCHALPAILCWIPCSPVIAGSPPEADRRAILAMAGEFEVLFNFEETVGLAKDYQLKDAYQEEATELVLVIEDTGPRIVLQHLLQMKNKEVIKHWTQTWVWQDTRLLEYQGKDRWKTRELSEEEAGGTWSQQVTQVDDSPRYEGHGRWRHDLGFSVWESNPTARPLPRREHTTRSDYHILEGVNRHALTPHGWVHEQDNLKLVLDDTGKPLRYLVRERGVNHYDRTTKVDFAPARDYWKATAPFWGKVAAAWESIASRHGAFSIKPKVDDRPLWKAMFALAEPLTAEKGAQVPESAEIEAQINRYLDADAE